MSLIASEVERRDRKTYDIKIIKWLFGFAKPYKKLMILSFVLMVTTAGLELLAPYVIKVAVDSYIYPSWREAKFSSADTAFETEIRQKYPASIIEIGKDSFLIDLSEIDKEDKTNLEKLGHLSESKYLVVNPAKVEPENLGKVQEIVSGHPGLFKQKGAVYYADHAATGGLSFSEMAALRSHEISYVTKLALAILAIYCTTFAFSTLYIYILNFSGQRIMHRLRVDMFSHILNLPQPFFDKNPVGRLTTRVTNDVNAINEMYTSVSVQFFKDIFVIVGVLVVMFFMNRTLTFFILGITVILGFVAAFFRMKLKTVYRNMRRTIAQLNAFVQESVRGIVLIKLYNRETPNHERFKGVNYENFQANMDQLFAFATFRPIIEFLSVTTVALILWYGGRRVIELELTIGALLAYLTYIKMLFKPIQELAESYNVFQSAIAASENLYDLAHSQPEEKRGQEIGKVTGKIEFRNVWFSYNGKDWILKDVSFTAEPGKTLAFVGLTGSGKTTIINLILKLYDIQKGEILFDGVPIQKIDPVFLRSNISTVFQDVFLFGKQSSNGHSAEEDWSLYNGNGDRFMHHNGKPESSGEKQIASLEEALSKKAKVLILDEATSHIDAQMELRVRQYLKEHSHDKTTIIVAHRLSNIREADKIIVIHHGEITETGTHSELLANKGIYHSLYQLQNELYRASS